MSNHENKVTILDIAEKANVSPSTVSRVLRSSAGVAQKKHDAVMQAVAELGYQPNIFAQSLASGQSMTIGVLTQNFGTPFYDGILQGILQGMEETNYWPIFADGRWVPAIEQKALEQLLARRVDGLILVGGQTDEKTLQKMAYGGIYDQLGGGFARYSTDANWLVPHFEKMLYDNALLSRVYLHAYQVTGKPLYRRIVEETLDFVLQDMRHKSGGFYSSYDADSEGVEGKFYTWSAAEIRGVLGDEDAVLFMRYYDVSERGNWEGTNILNVPRAPEEVAHAANLELDEMNERLAAAKEKLVQVRAQRIWPGLDDKVLTAWNGLMLASFAEAGLVLNRPDYTQAAVENAAFLYETMRSDGKEGAGNGRLLRTWKAGSRAKYNAYLEDYAYLADGLLALYQNTFDEQWFNWARELAEIMLSHFLDEENGGFFDTSDDHEALLHRPKDVQDNATPSANAMAAHVLLKLGLYTGDANYWDVAETAVSGLYGPMVQYPSAFAHWLCAAAFIMSKPQEVAIIGQPNDADVQALLAAVLRTYRPDLVVAVGESGDAVALLADREQIDDRATAYVCRQFVCQLPVTNAADLEMQLMKL